MQFNVPLLWWAGERGDISTQKLPGGHLTAHPTPEPKAYHTHSNNRGDVKLVGWWTVRQKNKKTTTLCLINMLVSLFHLCPFVGDTSCIHDCDMLILSHPWPKSSGNLVGTLMTSGCSTWRAFLELGSPAWNSVPQVQHSSAAGTCERVPAAWTLPVSSVVRSWLVVCGWLLLMVVGEDFFG